MIYIMNLKLTKFKGGQVGFKKQLYGLNKKVGAGTAAVKKLSDEELKGMEDLNIGGNINKIRSRAIKPLNFKL